ncbi:MAG: hypothetical protein KID09_10245 [Paenibacillus macerans]|nr:hypothetical protein [Paenibacillus macerans]
MSDRHVAKKSVRILHIIHPIGPGCALITAAIINYSLSSKSSLISNLFKVLIIRLNILGLNKQNSGAFVQTLYQVFPNLDTDRFSAINLTRIFSIKAGALQCAQYHPLVRRSKLFASY